MKLEEEKVFKDAVHGYIHVNDQLIWDLIQSSEFQRLRRIKQLGGTYMAFHTGEHSRFSHSLGVYAIAYKMINELSRKEKIFTEEERLLILASALLHDLGHGPFSHSFESIIGLNHEVFTARILMENTKVHQILEQYQIGFSKKVRDVIMKTYPNPVVISIISSQLDADRLDYLLRDAYFTGTPYGEIDVKRILRTMRVVDRKVVYKESGMHAIEDYLLSRYQMYWQVYLHASARSFELIVQRMLQRACELIRSGYSFNMDLDLLGQLLTEDEIPILIYLKFDDSTITYYALQFLECDDFILKDLADRFLNRRLLKEIYYTPSKKTNEILQQMRYYLTDMGIDPKYYLLTDYQMKVPYDYYGDRKKLFLERIELLMRDGSIREISEVSEVIKGIVSGKPKKEYKIYYPFDLLDGFPEGKEKQEVLSLLEEIKFSSIELRK